jgi:hypothetical protein
MNSKRLSLVEETKILGVMIDSDLSFKSHINTIAKNTTKVVSILSKARYYLPVFSLNLIYKSLIQSKFIYASNLWGFTYKSNVKRLELVQKRAAKTILFKKGDQNSAPLFKELKWLKIENLINFRAFIFIFKSINKLLCEPSNDLFKFNERRITRSQNLNHLFLQNYKLQYCRNSIFYKGIELWNKLELNIRSLKKFNQFKNNLFDHIFISQTEFSFS